LTAARLLVLAAAGATMAAAAEPSGVDALAGRELYRAQCAGCHEADGSGGREGGVTVPAVDWGTLARPRIIEPARPPYDDSAFVRAVKSGTDAGGRLLAPAMPRLELAPAQFDRLRAYLAIVGTACDPEPGVGPAEIRIGAVLPLSGADAATGRAVEAAVRAEFAEAGPIFGRVLKLQVEDPGGDVAAATARFATGDRVLALVATLTPDSADAPLPVIGRLDPAMVRAEALGRAAAATLVEALKQVGAKPTRAALAVVLKTMRRHGAAAANEGSTPGR